MKLLKLCPNNLTEKPSVIEIEVCRNLLRTYRDRLHQINVLADILGGVEYLPLTQFSELVDAQDRIIHYTSDLGLPSELPVLEVDKLSPYLPPAVNQPPKIDSEDLYHHYQALEVVLCRSLAHLERHRSLLIQSGRYVGQLDRDIIFISDKLSQVRQEFYFDGLTQGNK